VINFDLEKVKDYNDLSILLVNMRKKQRLMLVSKEDGLRVKSIYANPQRKGYVRYTYYNSSRYGACRPDQLHMYLEIRTH
jgi:ABC-type sulfate transport system substrate-binding protein